MLPLAGTAAVLLVLGHDLIKVGDNISIELNPSLRNLGHLALSHIDGALNGEPSVFRGTLVPFATYSKVDIVSANTRARDAFQLDWVYDLFCDFGFSLTIMQS